MKIIFIFCSFMAVPPAFSGTITSTLVRNRGVSLCDAAKDGDKERVQELIAAGVSVNLQDSSSFRTPLAEAAIQGHREVVHYLLEERADPNLLHPRAVRNSLAIYPLIPLFIAVGRRDREMAQDLLSHGANINSRDPSSGQTVLALAARLGDVEMVEYLLDHRADAGLTAFTGTSVLHAAALDRGAEERQREVSRILIRHGVVLNSRNSLRETPLFVAARSGNTGMVRDLLEAGADPHLTDYAGQTALFDAAGGGELGAVQALLSAGVDINRQSNYLRSTALHQAVRNEQSHVAAFLIFNGARTDLLDREGRTALHSASPEMRLAIQEEAERIFHNALIMANAASATNEELDQPLVTLTGFGELEDVDGYLIHEVMSYLNPCK